MKLERVVVRVKVENVSQVTEDRHLVTFSNDVPPNIGSSLTLMYLSREMAEKLERGQEFRMTIEAL